MSEAIWGLIGTIVGGLIVTITSFWTLKVQNDAQIKRDRLNKIAEARLPYFTALRESLCEMVMQTSDLQEGISKLSTYMQDKKLSNSPEFNQLISEIEKGISDLNNGLSENRKAFSRLGNESIVNSYIDILRACHECEVVMSEILHILIESASHNESFGQPKLDEKLNSLNKCVSNVLKICPIVIKEVEDAYSRIE